MAEHQLDDANVHAVGQQAAGPLVPELVRSCSRCGEWQRASGLLEHPSELGGSDVLGNISSFGIDGDGELYLVSYWRGIVFKVTGPLCPSPTPINPRIVR